ncbi:MAG: prepilin peptidase [Candidatus Altiarchaeota archaeon]|nr:prepilin peptidase [Candidatus Altiarchaeota archaeon]
MVIPIILVFFGFFVVFYSSVIDFLTTYLPERLVKYAIPTGLIGWLIYGVMNSNYQFFLNSILLTLTAFAIGGFLYYMRHWASGDMWLLAVSSATLGPAFPNFWPNFFLFSAIWAGILGIAYYFYYFIKHQIYLKHQALTILFLATLGLFLINPLSNMSLIGISLLLLLIYTRHDIENLFVFEKKVKDLEEDDWILEDLKIKDKVFKSSMPIGRKEAKWANKHGKGLVKVKTGVPMTPAFSFALLTLLLV